MNNYKFRGKTAEVKVGQIWETFLGETFEIKKIKGNMLYGIGRSRQGTPNSVIERCTKKDLLEISKLKKNPEVLEDK
jgi:hypothetical protein